MWLHRISEIGRPKAAASLALPPNRAWPPHWCDTNFVGIALCAVVSFQDYEDSSKRFSVQCCGKFENQDGSFTRFYFTLAGWNEPCSSLSHEPRKLTCDHVHGIQLLLPRQEFPWRRIQLLLPRQEFPCKASFEFYVTANETKKKIEESCEVIKCGMSLVYVHEDDDCMLLKKTNLVQLSLRNQPSCSYGPDDVVDDVRPKRGFCQFLGGEETDSKRMREEKITG